MGDPFTSIVISDPYTETTPAQFFQDLLRLLPNLRTRSDEITMLTEEY